MSENYTDERVPSIEESSKAIRGLIALWKEQNTLGTVEIPFMEGLPLVGVTIHIMAQHSVALSESVLVLTSANMFLKSAPLIRFTMECAVTAAWLSITPNAGNAALHEDARNSLATINSIFEDPERVDEDLLEDATAAVAELAEHKSEAARKFEKRCKKIAGGEKLYSLYGIMSGFSYAGIGLTDLYLAKVDESPTNPYGISLLDKSNFPAPDASLVHQVAMLALSMKAWDNILPMHPSRGPLENIAKNFGIGLEINLAKVHS
jgi:hypothetical protein